MMDQEYWKIIANRILSLRAKRGFSTYKLESMSGVDASTIESIEKDNPRIRPYKPCIKLRLLLI